MSDIKGCLWYGVMNIYTSLFILIFGVYHSSTSEAHISTAIVPEVLPGVPIDTNLGLLPQGSCLVPQGPIVIKENWVMCDACEKWRLLPYGMDSSKPLPKKWFCWMLDWL